MPITKSESGLLPVELPEGNLPAIISPPKPDPEKELHGAITQWQASRDPKHAAAMLRGLTPVFDRAIRQYVPDGDTPLIRADAKLIALQALPQYNPERGGPETFLRPYLQRLQRTAVQHNNIISMPERLLMQRQDLVSAERELDDSLGRSPTTRELADHLGISAGRIAKIRRAHLAQSEAQATLHDEDGNPQDPAVNQAPTQVAAELVYDSADDPADQLILEYGLGLHGREKLNTNQLARMLGISASAVSQRAAKLQDQINEMEQSNLF